MGKKLFYTGAISCLLGISLFIYGGNKIGKNSEYLGDNLVKRIENSYEMKEVALTKEEVEQRKLSVKEMEHRIYGICGGLASLVFGIVLGATKTSTLKLSKQTKPKGGFIKSTARYHVTDNESYAVDNNNRYNGF